jgi:Holliday junction resolvasome RuvABC endonuclease subunit
VTRILAADPGLVCTGWIVADCDRGSRKVVATGYHRSGSVSDRHESQLSRFCELLDQYQPEAVALEQYVYQGERSKTVNAFRISRLVGALEGAARGRGIRVIPGITKQVANRAAGLTGKVSARRVKQAVHAIFKIRGITNAHVDDAHLVLLAAGQRVGRRTA